MQQSWLFECCNRFSLLEILCSLKFMRIISVHWAWSSTQWKRSMWKFVSSWSPRCSFLVKPQNWKRVCVGKKEILKLFGVLLLKYLYIFLLYLSLSLICFGFFSRYVSNIWCAWPFTVLFLWVFLFICFLPSETVFGCWGFSCFRKYFRMWVTCLPSVHQLLKVIFTVSVAFLRSLFISMMMLCLGRMFGLMIFTVTRKVKR